MDAVLIAQFRDAACRKLRQDMDQITRCTRLLSDQEAWSRSNEHCNSIANLLLHLAGNIRQWIVSGIGGEPFDRDRPAEFAARDVRPVGPILAELERVVTRAMETIAAMDAAAVARTYAIQRYSVTGLQAVFHVAEHISFHTGQIVHMTKVLKNVDLSLYDEQGQRRQSAGGKPW